MSQLQGRPLSCAIRIAQWFEGLKTGNRTKTKPVKNLRVHVDSHLFGPFCNASGGFIVITRRLFDEQVRLVILRFVKVIIKRADNKQILLTAVAALLMTVKLTIHFPSKSRIINGNGHVSHCRSIFSSESYS